jgi:hypothetical protein
MSAREALRAAGLGAVHLDGVEHDARVLLLALEHAVLLLARRLAARDLRVDGLDLRHLRNDGLGKGRGRVAAGARVYGTLGATSFSSLAMYAFTFSARTDEVA